MLIIECYQDDVFVGYFRNMLRYDDHEFTMNKNHAFVAYNVQELILALNLLERIPGYTYIVKELDLCIA